MGEPCERSFQVIMYCMQSISLSPGSKVRTAWWARYTLRDVRASSDFHENSKTVESYLARPTPATESARCAVPLILRRQPPASAIGSQSPPVFPPGFHGPAE